MGLKPHKPSDYPSLLLYILDETHLSVTVLTASYILYTRSAHSVYFALGGLSASLVAKLVKRFIKSPRPPPPAPLTNLTSPSPSSSVASDEKSQRKSKSKSNERNNGCPTHIRPKKTYGMPSTHSTALTFYAIYLLPILLLPNHHFTSFASCLKFPAPSPYIPNGPLSGLLSRAGSYLPSPGSPTAAKGVTLSQSTRLASAAGISIYWLLGIWSRIELGYHTPGQCLGGVALGSLLAVLARGVWEANQWIGEGLQGFIDVLWGTVFR